MFTAYANYWDFQGRAGRAEYWWFALWIFGLGFVAGLIDALVFHERGLFGPCALVVTFANLIPNLSVGFRRLHDTDRSAWWLLVAAFPILGPLGLLVIMCQRGSASENRFGPVPGQRSYEDLHATFA